MKEPIGDVIWDEWSRRAGPLPADEDVIPDDLDPPVWDVGWLWLAVTVFACAFALTLMALGSWNWVTR